MGEEVEVKMKVKLFGVWSSPYSRRIKLALKLKIIPFEYVEEELSNKSCLLVKYNPVHKMIPVLVHNEKPILESLIILEYIDAIWKDHPLLPQDPYERAQARFWAKFIDNELLPSVWRTFLSKEEEKDKTKKEASMLLKTLESQLKDKCFFGGDKLGYLDIVANVVAFWIERVQEVVGIELISQENFPILCSWIERFYDVSIAKECLPPKHKHLVYIKARYEVAHGTNKDNN
ncbi:glutathione S-transferase U7-like [Chenopodium quinoa]|uniref:glutathione S-transferase U7-like n=1 Tax=Chenopodium quinoa TaxID=63459 RepID=UPI000B76D865|nr:glutathione S-transferase U7-like [Chenopodium quinoa]